jgi:cytochrome P450
VQAFLTLFGFPLDMRDQLMEWKDAVLVDASGNTVIAGAATEAAMGKAGELFLYLSDLVVKRRGVAASRGTTCSANSSALTARRP